MQENHVFERAGRMQIDCELLTELKPGIDGFLTDGDLVGGIITICAALKRLQSSPLCVDTNGIITEALERLCQRYFSAGEFWNCFYSLSPLDCGITATRSCVSAPVAFANAITDPTPPVEASPDLHIVAAATPVVDASCNTEACNAR